MGSLDRLGPRGRHRRTFVESVVGPGQGSAFATYIVQSCSVLCRLDDLNGDVLANLQAGVCRQWYLRQAEGAVVCNIGWADDLKRRYYIVAHVWRSKVPWSLDADVDVYKGH